MFKGGGTPEPLDAPDYSLPGEPLGTQVWKAGRLGGWGENTIVALLWLSRYLGQGPGQEEDEKRRQVKVTSLSAQFKALSIA